MGGINDNYIFRNRVTITITDKDGQITEYLPKKYLDVLTKKRADKRRWYKRTYTLDELKVFKKEAQIVIQELKHFSNRYKGMGYSIKYKRRGDFICAAFDKNSNIIDQFKITGALPYLDYIVEAVWVNKYNPGEGTITSNGKEQILWIQRKSLDELMAHTFYKDIKNIFFQNREYECEYFIEMYDAEQDQETKLVLEFQNLETGYTDEYTVFGKNIINFVVRYLNSRMKWKMSKRHKGRIYFGEVGGINDDRVFFSRIKRVIEKEDGTIQKEEIYNARTK